MTSSARPPAYTRQFWAKAYPYRQRGPERIHLLEHHMADVGACFEALLAQPTIRNRLARAGGLAALDDATVARLALFAALHDIGKVNVGFQTQVWRDADLPGGQRKPRRAGHTLDLTPVLNNDDKETADWFFNALGWWNDAASSWDDCDGKSVCGLFVAALSHHGMPLQVDNPNRPANPRIWRRYGKLNPQEYIERVGRLARRWFPAAFETDASPLPSAPPFQHMFLGLCNLADWIGSNECRFTHVEEPRDGYMEEARRKAKEAVAAIGLDVSEQRAALSGGAAPFAQLFGFAPNAIQRAAVQDVPPEERLVVIESETGSGKTEAALWRFARMYEAGLVDGLYFALPTRAAASEIHGRVERFIANLPLEPHRPPVVRAVPGYDPDADAHAVELPGHESQYDEHDAPEKPWASENPKRFLAAQIAVGTVDQAMMGALRVKNAHMRAACLARNLLVVDEVHASDTYMRRILKALLDAHLGSGGYALLMSATLGSIARRQWLSAAGRRQSDVALSLHDAIESPYPAVSTMAPTGESVTDVDKNGQEKNVSVASATEMGDFAAVAERAVTAARAGAKVLVVPTPSPTPSVHRRRWRSWPAPAAKGCCSPARTRRPCTTADSPPATAACWTARWCSGWARSATPTGWSWWARRPWSSRWTSTPTC